MERTAADPNVKSLGKIMQEKGREYLRAIYSQVMGESMNPVVPERQMIDGASRCLF
jgi:hypothetical protein